MRCLTNFSMSRVCGTSTTLFAEDIISHSKAFLAAREWVTIAFLHIPSRTFPRVIDLMDMTLHSHLMTSHYLTWPRLTCHAIFLGLVCLQKWRFRRCRPRFLPLAGGVCASPTRHHAPAATRKGQKGNQVMCVLLLLMVLVLVLPLLFNSIF